MQQMRQQALRWGAQCITDDVVAVDFQSRPFKITTAEQAVYKTHFGSFAKLVLLVHFSKE